MNIEWEACRNAQHAERTQYGLVVIDSACAFDERVRSKIVREPSLQFPVAERRKERGLVVIDSTCTTCKLEACFQVHGIGRDWCHQIHTHSAQ